MTEIDLTLNDYNAMAGPDWPDYSDFINGNQPDFVLAELKQMIDARKQYEKSLPEFFCVEPFYSIEYPGKSRSCMTPGLKDMDKIKEQILAGEKPTECSRCWKLEDSQTKSPRMLKNETLDWLISKNLVDLYHDAKNNRSRIVQYKIDTSNTCNSTCITCSSHGSTLWAKYEKLSNITPYRSWSVAADSFDIDYKNAAIITFTGGEPLLSKENFKILERLILNNNTNCLVAFVTNGSVRVSDDQLSLLKAFKHTNFCFSIDGTESVFEYMRFPIKWDTLVSNVKWYADNNFGVSANITVSNLNIMYYNEITKWCRSISLPFQTNVVSSPTWFAPESLPQDIKSAIRARFSQCNLIGKYLNSHSEKDDIAYSMFLDKIKEQDRVKEIDGRKYLPEFFKMLDSRAN